MQNSVSAYLHSEVRSGSVPQMATDFEKAEPHPIRNVPGSQPPFSLNPDPDQNKEDSWFISFVAYDHYIPLSLPTQLLSSTSPKFWGNCRRSRLDPGTEIRNSFCRFSLASNNFSKENSRHIKHYTMGNQAQYGELPWHILFCHNRRLKIKRPRA